jgi:hypothetical protein
MTAREVLQEIIKASRIKTGAIRSANEILKKTRAEDDSQHTDKPR